MTATPNTSQTLATCPRSAIFALAFGAFAIGTSEFMISGLLRDVAADLGVSIPTAGLLITGYAAGVAFGGPIVTLATGRLERKHQIILLLAIFVVGNIVCALSTSYWVLLSGRIIGSFCHGAFYGSASVAAGVLASTEHRARAVALVSAGVMVANVVGVPLGTAIGQIVGWRVAFWGVSGLGALAAVAVVLWLPSRLVGSSANLKAEVGALLRPNVLRGLVLGLCFTIGLFVTFSYLTPLLMEISRATPAQVPLLLMVFGAGATAGVLCGGRLADWRLRLAITLAFLAQIAAYAAMIVLSQHLSAMWFVLFALGVASMSAVAPLRVIVLNGAADAPGLASTVTSSAFNLGVAIGAAFGAALLATGVSYALLPTAGIALAALGLAIVHARS